MTDDYKDVIAAAIDAGISGDGIAHVLIERKEDGRYKIVAVSTAQIEDREGETFTTKAMDYDIDLAETTGAFPEFRVFHKKGLGIGKVTRMTRVGMFAVDEGYSYDDPFSMQVCEKMLLHNDGVWKVSRGFEVHEMSGGCPNCSEDIVIGLKHMIAGYRCPSCNSVYIEKGMLRKPHFLKTRTFDITVTDIPAVPMTGVSAFQNLEFKMDKKQLRMKLIEAGIEEDIVDSRLDGLSEVALKELRDMDEIPYAVLLKELTTDDEEDVEEEDEDIEYIEDDALVLDEGVIDEIAGEVVERVKQLFEGAEFQVQDMDDGFEIEFKEIPAITALEQRIQDMGAEIVELKEMISTLLTSDDKRLKQIVKKSSTNGRLRVIRAKAMDEEDDYDEDEEDDEEDNRMPATTSKKSLRGNNKVNSDGIVIPGGAKSLTEFLSTE